MSDKPSVAQYLEAVTTWQRAVDEMDQSISELRPLGMHQIAARRIHPMTAEEISRLALVTWRTLRDATCDECGELILEHPIKGCSEWVA